MPQKPHIEIVAIVTLLGIDANPLSLRPDKAIVAVEIGPHWSLHEVEIQDE